MSGVHIPPEFDCLCENEFPANCGPECECSHHLCTHCGAVEGDPAGCRYFCMQPDHPFEDHADTPDPRPVSPPSELTAEGRLRADVAAHRYLAYRASDVEVLLALLDAARAAPQADAGLREAAQRLSDACDDQVTGRVMGAFSEPGWVTFYSALRNLRAALGAAQEKGEAG